MKQLDEDDADEEIEIPREITVSTVDAIERLMKSLPSAVSILDGTHPSIADDLDRGRIALEDFMQDAQSQAEIADSIWRLERKVRELREDIEEERNEKDSLIDKRRHLLNRIEELESCHKETVVGILQDIFS